jgi:hypothetical protein
MKDEIGILVEHCLERRIQRTHEPCVITEDLLELFNLLFSQADDLAHIDIEEQPRCPVSGCANRRAVLLAICKPFDPEGKSLKSDCLRRRYEVLVVGPGILDQ